MNDLDRELDEPDIDQQIHDWKQIISTGPAVRVEILRVQRGKRPVLIDVVDELVDEDTLRELFGGGKYLLRAKKADAAGRYCYAACVSVNLAGEPRSTPPTLGAEPPEARLQEIVMATVEKLIKPLERRLAALERAVGTAKPKRS
jgi:hypothetical protein